MIEPAATALHAVNLAAGAAHRPLAELNALRRQSAISAGAGRVFDPLEVKPEESAFDVVVDAVGGKVTRAASMAAVRPGGVVMHIGLMDNDGGFDARKMTLQEITVIGTYTYTPLDLRAAVLKLHQGAFGELGWLEQRSLEDGPRAFDDLLHGRSGAPKIVLRP